MQNNFDRAAAKSDDELVREARQGDEASFAELMRRHSAGCFKVAVSILRDPQEAEDQVQNAFWQAYRNIGRFAGEARFSTWITRIVINQCLMRLRQQRRARLVHLEDIAVGEDRGVMEFPDASENPEQALGRKEMTQLLAREMRRIPPLLRRALELHELDELTMPQVAAELGVTLMAAKSRLLRARNELRRRLEKCCGPAKIGALVSV